MRGSSGNRIHGLAISFGMLILASVTEWAIAQPSDAPSRKARTEALLGTLKDDAGSAPGRARYSADGFLRHLAAGPGRHFVMKGGGAASADPEKNAREFLSQWGELFVAPSPSAGFTLRKLSATGGRQYVRFDQAYAGMPVFSAQMIVQIEQGYVTNVQADLLHDFDLFDQGTIPLLPGVTADEARQAALDLMTPKSSSGMLVADLPALMIYAPPVVGNAGGPALVWKTVVESTDGPYIRELVLVDAHRGSIALNFTMVETAMTRSIYDSNNTSADPGTLVRIEGGPAVGPPDADLAYTYFGDTYNFYFTNHGRDSINGSGLTMSGTVRYCDPLDSCPYANAFWSGSRMYFGQGFAAADDVVGHELTHGVTQYESNLVYLNQSGAINESFSDVWGELIDQNNGGGTDTPAVKWLMGEDVPGFGAIRSMIDPTSFGDPDRTGSPKFYTGPFDNGGVHINSGVNNKLCYLLTDGATFNGRTTVGMGYAKVADLYYEVQANLLLSSADYLDLYDALTQAGINIGLTLAERDNVEQGCLAVEINVPPPMPAGPINDDCAAPLCIADGVPFDGSTMGATGSITTTCSSGDNNDVWFTYRPTVSGPVTVDTAESAMDTTLAIYATCGGAQLACNDDFGTGLTSSLTYTMTGGVTYRIRVAGYAGETGAYRLKVTGGSGICTAGEPNSPLPADGATLVATTPTLSWNGNGGFETGTLAGWGSAQGPGTPYLRWTVTTAPGVAFFANGAPAAGDFFAQNGFDGSAGITYDLFQEVAIPAAPLSAILSWRERIQWDLDTFCGGCLLPRLYEVTIQPSGGGSPILALYSQSLTPATIGDTGYVSHTLDLRSMAPSILGTTVRLNWKLTVPESLTGPAQFDLDEVKLDFNDYPLNGMIARREGRTEGAAQAREWASTEAFEKRVAEYPRLKAAGAGKTGKEFSSPEAAASDVARDVFIPCPATYDVYFGRNPLSLTKIGGALSSPVFTPPFLRSNTTYYWKIVAKNCAGQVIGPVWSFQTGLGPNGAEGWTVYP